MIKHVIILNKEFKFKFKIRYYWKIPLQSLKESIFKDHKIDIKILWCFISWAPIKSHAFEATMGQVFGTSILIAHLLEIGGGGYVIKVGQCD